MGVELQNESVEVWTITFSVPASAPAGTVVIGNITRIIGQPSQQIVVVPNTELWSIEDLYTQASQTPDANIQPVRNASIQPFQPDLNSLIVQYQTRVKLENHPLILKPGDQFYINAITTSANGSSAVTLTLYAKVVRMSLVNQ